MSELLAELGVTAGPAGGTICPGCSKILAASSSLCTHCGLNLQTGQRVLSKEERLSVQSEFGHAKLDEVAGAMRREKVQQSGLKKAGMPFYLLAVVVLACVGFGTMGVMMVDVWFPQTSASKTGNSQKAAAKVDPKQQRMKAARVGVIIYFGAALVAFCLHIAILVVAFKETAGQGLLTTFVPLYILFFVFTRWARTRELFISSVICYVIIAIAAVSLLSLGVIRTSG
jgi:hypothetical protein